MKTEENYFDENGEYLSDADSAHHAPEFLARLGQIRLNLARQIFRQCLMRRPSAPQNPYLRANADLKRGSSPAPA
jgi:hypothetical protein